jgi:hypothetical protein
MREENKIKKIKENSLLLKSFMILFFYVNENKEIEK